MAFDESNDPRLKERHLDNERRQKLIDPRIVRKVDYAEHIRKEIFG